MAVSRYDNRNSKLNEDDLYLDSFEERNLDFIQHYTTPEFKEDNSYNLTELQIVEHVWKQGDKLYNLAARYYNEPSYWWVICKFNKKPTESHFLIGQTIYIPLNLQKALVQMGM